MPRVADGVQVLASLLDRLLDDAPQDKRESPFQARFDLARQKQAVARDLENLLNTRCTMDQERLQPYPLAAGSLLAYGIPDLSSLSLLNPDHRKLLQENILRTIKRFEPRLAQVRVDLDAQKEFNRMLRFKVQAVLRVHPSQPPVVFDALLQLSSHTCQIKSQG